jgi:hypothetical protein
VAVWYEPEEAWPEHAKSYWRHALDLYRNAQWRLHYIDAPHRFGVVQCPCGQHTVNVDKTASAGAFYASMAPTKIRACEKSRGADSVSSKIHRATRLVANAEHLMDEAEAGLEHLERYDRLSSLLDHALGDEEADKVAGEVAAADATAVEARALVASNDIEPRSADNRDHDAGQCSSEAAGANMCQVDGSPDRRPSRAPSLEDLVDELVALEDVKPTPHNVEGQVEAAGTAATQADQALEHVRPGRSADVRRRADGVHDRVGAAQDRLARLRDETDEHEGAP